MSNYIENNPKLLVVEDNETIIEGLEYLLEKEGFKAIIVNTKKEAEHYIDTEQFDLFLLDVQLPDGTGFDLCKYIKQKSDMPIIFISARTEEINVVYGLDIGADDYITKPFRSDELVSRINCVLRRYKKQVQDNNIIKYRNIKVNIETAKVYKDNEEIFLTNLEYRILLMFLNNINKLITRDELLEKIWDIDGNYVNDNTVSVYIKRLRMEMGDTEECQMLKTIRGIGYILNK